MTKRFGFTLAEVLITLGIIGVVAAMTIPTLISNTNGAKFRSQFKKTLSTLNQAGLMAQAQYDFDYAGTTDACKAGASDHPDSDLTFCGILNGTLTGQTYYESAASIKRNNNGEAADYAIKSDGVLNGIKLENYHAYTLADGSIVAFDKSAKGCELPIGSQLTADSFKAADADTGTAAGALANCTGFIDVNGATLPNKEVSCSGTSLNTETNKSENIKTSRSVESPCAVKNDANHMTDIFPIVFHDATVEPASNAAKYVLTTSK